MGWERRECVGTGKLKYEGRKSTAGLDTNELVESGGRRSRRGGIMARFTVRGEIIPFIGNQKNIRVHNVHEMRQFWDTEGIDTDMDWNRSEVLVTVSVQEFVNRCSEGDIVDYTIETWDRADGRRIRGVDLQVVTPAGH